MVLVLTFAIGLPATNTKAKLHEPRFAPPEKQPPKLLEGVIQRRKVLPKRTSSEDVSSHKTDSRIHSLLVKNAGSGHAEGKCWAANGINQARNQAARTGNVQHATELLFCLDPLSNLVISLIIFVGSLIRQTDLERLTVAISELHNSVVVLGERRHKRSHVSRLDFRIRDPFATREKWGFRESEAHLIQIQEVRRLKRRREVFSLGRDRTNADPKRLQRTQSPPCDLVHSPRMDRFSRD